MKIDFREAVELMKAGKEEGFNKLYSATYNSVYFRAKQCTKNESDAQDLVQITFVEAYKNISKLDTSEATLAWLYTIVYNQSCKMYRNEREKKEYLLTEEAEGLFDTIEDIDIDTIPELSVDQKATAEIVRKIIEELSELQKMTVLAFYFDNLKLEQIAELMDCSVNTVKSRLNYARKYIKDRVEEEEKKGGYKLHAFTLPTLLPALKLLSKRTILTAHAAENVYAKSCQEVGLKASSLVLEGADTAGSTASDKSSFASSTESTVSAKATAVGKIGVAKVLMIAGAVTLGGAGVIGGLYAYNHSKQTVILENAQSKEDLQQDDLEDTAGEEIVEYDSQGEGQSLEECEENTSEEVTDIDIEAEDVMSVDYSEYIGLSILNETDESKIVHPQKISDTEYIFTSDFLMENYAEEYIFIGWLDLLEKCPVQCEKLYLGDYLLLGENGSDAGVGITLMVEYPKDIVIVLSQKEK